MTRKVPLEGMGVKMNGFSTTINLFEGDKLESAEVGELSSYTTKSKIDKKQFLKREKLHDFFTAIPQSGEALHIVCNGVFDSFMFVPRIVELIGDCNEGYFSTWTMNRANVLQMLELYDTERIKKINVITGLYFKRRETAVYATLVEGLVKRNQRCKAFKNHAKIMLLENGSDYVTIESSANFTANPRLEQHVITNDKGLYLFHKGWIDKIL